MDTALITFMLQTSPHVQSVDLMGSWDNFTKHYPMERDVKRSRNHWRGCYTFQDIICDGDGGNSPKRTGGLRMGCTYYYYYEIDGSTEAHDPSIPSTTSCPYLPGQAVNLLNVPIEIQPLRHRSASTSAMTIADIMTMNPADKFMTPRPPPVTPALSRLNTSSSVLLKKRRTARSVSPDSEKSSWSPRSFFGRRSAVNSSLSDYCKRGRSSSMTKAAEAGADILYSALMNRSDELRKVKSVPHSRDHSPQAFGKPSREPSPRRSFPRDSSTHHAATFEIPDEIAEEAEEVEDDDNFALHLARISMSERGLVTGLSPPPAQVKSPTTSILSAIITSKPLPQLPQEALLPSPLRLRSVISEAELPRSHFSISTVSTNVGSPTSSYFGFSETPSMSDYNDEESLTADTGSGDETSARSTLADERDWQGFSGYSLPSEEFASELTLKMGTLGTSMGNSASRKTFGGEAVGESVGVGGAGDGGVGVGVGAGMGVGVRIESVSTLEQFLSEVGYLSDLIVGKEMH